MQLNGGKDIKPVQQVESMDEERTSSRKRRRAASKPDDEMAEAVDSQRQTGEVGGITDDDRREDRSPEVYEHRQVAAGIELLASNASVQSQDRKPKGRGGRKKKVKRVSDTEVQLSESDRAWIESLSGPRLDLMVGLKKLGMRRLETAGSDAYAGVLGPRELRVMGIVLEEFIKDQLRKVERTLQRQAVSEEQKGHDNQVQRGHGEELEGRETGGEEAVTIGPDMTPRRDADRAFQAEEKGTQQIGTDLREPEVTRRVTRRATTRTAIGAGCDRLKISMNK